MKVEQSRQANDGNWTFEVNDTGIGIDSGNRNRIFEAFQQVENTPDRRYDGTGLGLTICKKLAGLMKAELSLESEIGKGSSFRLHFDQSRAKELSLKAS